VVEATASNPSAKIPLVLLPAAEPPRDAALAAAAVPLMSQAKVYLLRVVELLLTKPSAKMPTVPLTTPVDAPNPNPCADAAPFEKIVGIRYPHLYWV
jgi:hypothetical protein